MVSEAFLAWLSLLSLSLPRTFLLWLQGHSHTWQFVDNELSMRVVNSDI